MASAPGSALAEHNTKHNRTRRRWLHSRMFHPGRMLHPGRIWIACLLVLPIVAAIWLVDIKDLCAHNPHDPINALALSSTYAQDHTMFIVNSGQLFRSRDGGVNWQRLVDGLDNKHLLSSIAAGPSPDGTTDKARGGTSVPQTVFVSSDKNGIYRSQDGGDSWVQVNKGLQDLDIGPLAIDTGCDARQDSSAVVLAAAWKGGLYRTETGGESWSLVLDNDIQIAAIAFAPPTAGHDPARADDDARTRDQVSFALAGSSQGALYASTDEGLTWQQIWQMPRAGHSSGAITVIAFSPAFALDGTVFVGTRGDGVYKAVFNPDASSGSDVTNVTLTPVNVGLPFTWRDRYTTLRASASGPMLRRSESDVLSIALSPDYARDRTLFVSLWNQAVFKSENGGETWRRYPLGLTCSYQADMDEHKSPHFMDIRISDGYRQDKTVFLGGFDGLFKSTDGGRHWEELPTLPTYTTGMALCPDRPGTLALSTAGDGTYVTDDQGLSWNVVNVGLASGDVSNIAFAAQDAADLSRLYATSVIGYLYTTEIEHPLGKGGATDSQSTDPYRWVRIVLGNTEQKLSARRLLRTTFNVLRLPNWLSAHILGEAAETKPSSYTVAASPAFASDQTLFLGTRYHGLLRSVDGGKSFQALWTPTGTDGKPISIMDLAVSAHFDTDRTLYAGLRSSGIWKSTDGGETWQAANEGLWFVDEWASASEMNTLSEQDIKIEMSPDYSASASAGDRTVFVASSVGLWKTTDAGQSWQNIPIAPLLDSPYVVDVGLSPVYGQDQTLIVSVKGKGLFKSQDGGKSFAPVEANPTTDGTTDKGGMPHPAIGRSLSAITALGFSPQYAVDQTVYAASPETLFVSSDGGQTWRDIDTPARHEDDKQVIEYNGEWTRVRDERYSAGTVRYAQPDASSGPDAERSEGSPGPSVSLEFVGTGIRWICTRANDQGIAHVYIDGQYMGQVDQYSENPEYAIECFSVSSLDRSSHTIHIQVRGNKNPASTGTRIVLDALEVTH